jgi:hypothetical protein
MAKAQWSRSTPWAARNFSFPRRVAWNLFHADTTGPPLRGYGKFDASALGAAEKRIRHVTERA